MPGRAGDSGEMVSCTRVMVVVELSICCADVALLRSLRVQHDLQGLKVSAFCSALRRMIGSTLQCSHHNQTVVGTPSSTCRQATAVAWLQHWCSKQEFLSSTVRRWWHCVEVTVIVIACQHHCACQNLHVVVCGRCDGYVVAAKDSLSVDDDAAARCRVARSSAGNLQCSSRCGHVVTLWWV